MPSLYAYLKLIELSRARMIAAQKYTLLFQHLLSQNDYVFIFKAQTCSLKVLAVVNVDSHLTFCTLESFHNKEFLIIVTNALPDEYQATQFFFLIVMILQLVDFTTVVGIFEFNLISDLPNITASLTLCFEFVQKSGDCIHDVSLDRLG